MQQVRFDGLRFQGFVGGFFSGSWGMSSFLATRLVGVVDVAAAIQGLPKLPQNVRLKE